MLIYLWCGRRSRWRERKIMESSNSVCPFAPHFSGFLCFLSLLLCYPTAPLHDSDIFLSFQFDCRQVWLLSRLCALKHFNKVNFNKDTIEIITKNSFRHHVKLFWSASDIEKAYAECWHWIFRGMGSSRRRKNLGQKGRLPMQSFDKKIWSSSIREFEKFGRCLVVSCARTFQLFFDVVQYVG